MNANNQWEQFLDPVFLRERLISASVFLIAYEFLKESIVGRVKAFYMNGIQEGKLITSEDYTKKVLALHKNPLYASLKWLEQFEVFNQEDLQKIEDVKKIRNALAHELSALITKGEDFDHITGFNKAIELISKVEKWWIINFELAIDPDFSDKDIDEDGIVSGPILTIQMMLEVLSGNEELLKVYKQNKQHG